jgi:hypothetical protein
MKSFKRLKLILLLLAMNGTGILAQDKDVPLAQSLSQNSEKWLIKIGMITDKKPPKLKFGDYVTDNRRGYSSSTDETKLIGPSDPKTTQFKFGFDLVNRSNDSAFVEASVDVRKDSLRDVSVYMATNLKPEELWILILKEPSGKNEMSLSDMVLTNGDEEISLNYVMGDPLGKGEITAPKGITLMLEGLTLGTMQYDSGGTFAYKKYIWINQQADPQLQLISAAVFSAIMETAGYFEKVILLE